MFVRYCLWCLQSDSGRVSYIIVNQTATAPTPTTGYKADFFTIGPNNGELYLARPLTVTDSADEYDVRTFGNNYIILYLYFDVVWPLPESKQQLIFSVAIFFFRFNDNLLYDTSFICCCCLLSTNKGWVSTNSPQCSFLLTSPLAITMCFPCDACKWVKDSDINFSNWERDVSQENSVIYWS